MKIDIEKQLHQDNLKAEIYHQFKTRYRNSDMNIVCEYKVTKCRFDLIVYETTTNDVLAIIEVRRINAKGEPKLFGRKHCKYAEFGVAILYISEFHKIDDLFDSLDYISYLKLLECTTTSCAI